jgi:hypothetical protein
MLFGQDLHAMMPAASRLPMAASPVDVFRASGAPR